MSELNDKSRLFVKRREIKSNEVDEVSLTYDEIQPLELINKIRDASAGAISSFLGTTRDSFEDRTVTHLEYESYPEMALDYMLEICNKVREKWELIHIVIQHKLGPCPIKDISIAIIIASAHRKDSLEAVHYAIDELKKTVPIWKKEFYDIGNSEWKNNQIT